MIIPEDRKYVRYFLAKDDTSQLQKITSDLAEVSAYYRSAGKTLFVGIGGHPRTGKTQFTEDIQTLLMENHEIRACVVRMNGYRNSTHSEETRNAESTFDGERLLEDVLRAKEKGQGQFPAWHKEINSVIPDQINYDSQVHQIVLVEGLYVLLDQSPWKDLPFGQSYFFDFSQDVVSQRKVTSEKLDGNDIKNAELI
jgi:pantothenate kinase